MPSLIILTSITIHLITYEIGLVSKKYKFRQFIVMLMLGMASFLSSNVKLMSVVLYDENKLLYICIMEILEVAKTQWELP